MIEPQIQTRDQRLTRAQAISDELLRKFGDRVLAVSVYGSTGRGDDRPYSDLEMLCVIPGLEGIEYLFWLEQGLKISVDLMSPETIIKSVQTVEEDWPITGSEYTSTMPLHDPTGFWASLTPIQEAIPAEVFKTQMRGVMLGYIFEYLCKLKNDHQSGRSDNFPYIATEIAHCGTRLMGLHHRHLYCSNTSHLRECLELADRPEGLDELLGLVMSGRLSTPDLILQAVERFWSGAVVWCQTNKIALEGSFVSELQKM